METKRKSLATYLNEKEKKKLEDLKEAFGEKTLSSTIKRMIHFFHSLKNKI